MKSSVVLLLTLLACLQAQQPQQQAADKYEYCTLTAASVSSAAGKATATAYVRYATEQGFRTEKVEIIRDLVDQNLDSYPPEAVAKALAQLGSQGWELVSVATGRGEPPYSLLHYLKRRVR